MITQKYKKEKEKTMKKLWIVLIGMLVVSSFLSAQTIILQENFEGDVSAWTFGTTGQTNRWYRGSATSYTGTKAAYISADNGANASYSKTSASTSWLERTLDLTEFSSATLSFWWRCLGQGGVVPNDFGDVWINNTPVSSLREFVGQSTWTHKEGIDLSGYAGQTVTLKFRWVNNSSAGNDPPFCVDDILITGEYGHDFATLTNAQDSRSMKNMAVYAGQTIPFNVVVKNMGIITESSPVKWTCDGGTPTSDTDETTIVLAPGETVNHVFSPEWTAPMTSGTYTVQFFTDLANDVDPSNDLTSITFTVLEKETIPYSENFDATIPPGLPEGWSRENSNNDVYAWYLLDSYPRSQSNHAAISGTNLRPMNDWLFSPPLQMTGGITYMVSFWTAITQSGDTHNLKVHWGEFPTSVAMINGPVFERTLTSVPYEENICYITPSSSGVYYLGWHGHSAANSSFIFMDDIKIKQAHTHDFATLSFSDDARSMRNMVVAPNTEMLLYIALRNEGFTTESSPVSWTASGGEPAMNSETSSVLAQGQSEKFIFTTPWTSPATPGFYTINFFTDVTGDGDTTNDLTSIFITVSEPATLPVTENFDSILPPDLPEGWSIENTNRDFKQWQTTSSYAPHSSPNHLVLWENPHLNMDDWLFSLPLQLETGKFYDVSFYYYTGGLTQSIELKWGTAAHSEAMTLGTLFNDVLPNNDVDYHQGTATFSPVEDGIYYLGWHGFTNATGLVSSTLFLDSIEISEQDIHDFGILSYEEDNQSIDDMKVLVNAEAAFYVVVKNFGSYTESSPIKWTATGGSPLTHSSETTIVLAPDESTRHFFAVNWLSPSVPGFYYVTFYTDLPDDGNPANDELLIEIEVIDRCSLPIAEDFESGLEKFDNTAGNSANWQTNNALFHSGEASAWNSYSANNNNSLIQQCVMDLTLYDNPHVSFYHIAKTEAVNDKAFVEVSTDLGENWSALSGLDYHGASENFATKGYFDETCYSDWGTGNQTPTNSWWKQEVFDLSSFKTESTVFLRFRLTSNAATHRYGWLIDDISIQDLTEPYAAFNPQPEQEATEIYACLPKLSWTNGFGTEEVDVYLSSNYSQVNTLNAAARVVENQDTNEYEIPNRLDFFTTYYWRVVSKNSSGNSNGEICSFTTMSGNSAYMENFESGDFSSFAWQHGGNAPWLVQNTTVLQGNYSAQSGAISHNQTSDLSVSMTILTNGNISFNYKTDSEANFDKLIFYIDGVEQGSWSGITEETSQTYFVTAGLRTFLWRYQKNVTGTSGADAVWLDCISFPPFETTTLSTPQNLAISLVGNDVRLQWDAVDDATAYNIYRSIQATEGFEYLNSTDDLFYLDVNALNEEQYFYRVTAISSEK
jgi:hypothetical protein